MMGGQLGLVEGRLFGERNTSSTISISPSMW